MIILISLLSLSCCQDLQGTIKRVSSFLQWPLAEDELYNCVKHCSFSSMKDNKMVNYTLIAEEIMDHSKGSFMRKGGALFYYMQINQSWLINCASISHNMQSKCKEELLTGLLVQWFPTCGPGLQKGSAMNLRGHKRIKETKQFLWNSGYFHLFRPLVWLNCSQFMSTLRPWRGGHK